jgi:hypothetical protein
MKEKRGKDKRIEKGIKRNHEEKGKSSLSISLRFLVKNKQSN